MKIASRVKEALEDGKSYTIGQIWQLVNGAEIVHKKPNGVIYSIGEMSKRLRDIAGDDFIGRDQLERSVKGLCRRGTLIRANEHPKIFAGDKTYIVATPITYYQKA